jgi:hypothetical protein
VIVGTSTRAARDHARHVVEDEEFARWATEQADLVGSICKDHNKIVECASILKLFGADTKAVPVALSKRGWLSTQDISRGPWPEEILLVEGRITNIDDNEYAGVELNEGVLVISSTHHMGFPIDMEEFWNDLGDRPIRSIPEEEELGWWQFNCGSVSGSVVAALAMAWSSTVEAVLSVSEMPVEVDLPVRVIGRRASQDVSKQVRIVRKSKGLEVSLDRAKS